MPSAKRARRGNRRSGIKVHGRRRAADHNRRARRSGGAAKARRSDLARPPAAELRREIEQRLTSGHCAYCGRPARPDQPLTREHAIPRCRGAGRREWRVIVPACGDCNRHRGAQLLSAYLAAAPGRISRLVQYLGSLPAPALRQVDVRVFAEVLAAATLADEGYRIAGSEAGELPLTERVVCRRRQAARRLLERLHRRLAGARSCGEGGSFRRPGDAAQRVPILGHLAAVLAMAWGAWEGELRAELATLQRGGRSERGPRLALAGVTRVGASRPAPARRAVA